MDDAGAAVYAGRRVALFRGLRVRMGLHWDTPMAKLDSTTHRMDYYGTPVNRAARVEGIAVGGQVLISQVFPPPPSTLFSASRSSHGSSHAFVTLALCSHSWEGSGLRLYSDSRTDVKMFGFCIL